MPYTPPDNDAVNFSEDGSYSPPSNDAVNFSEDAGGQTTASGTVTVTGSASPTVTQTAPASGSVSVTGDYTEILRPSASGTATVTGSANAAIVVKASASGSVSVTGVAQPPTVGGFQPIEDVASTTFLKLVNPNDATDTVAIPDDAFEFIEGTQNREHTAVKDWGISVKPRDDSLTERVFDKVVLVHRGVQFGVGRLLRVDPDYSDEEMALEGYGRLYEMRTEPARKIYKDTPYFRAIDDFLSDAETVDAHTLVEPTPQTVLDDEEIVNAPAVDGFDDLGAEITSTTPIDIDATGGVSTQQTCFHLDGSTFDSNTGVIITAGQLDSSYYVDDGGIAGLDSAQAPTSVSYEFTTTYKMPANAISLQLRRGISGVGAGTFVGEINVYLTPEGGSETEIGGKQIKESNDNIPVWDEIPIDASGDLPVGTHSIRIELTVSEDSAVYEIDRLAFYDDRFEYDFDGTASDLDSNDQIAGPELYPDAVEAVLVDDALGSNIETVDVSSTFVGGEAGRWALSVGTVTLEPTDGDANPSFNVDANDAFGTGLQLSLELGRKGTRTDTSPTEGFEPEKLTDLVVNVTTNDLRTIEGKKDYLGTEFDVLKKLCDESRYRFRTDPKADLGVVDIEAFRPEDRRTQLGFEWEDSLSASVDAFDYFNAARGLGRRKVGDRISAERADDDEIADKGVRVGKAKTFSRAIADKAELRTELEKYLAEGVSNYNRDLSGTAYLQDIQPGGEVYVPVRDEFIPLERVRIDFASETMDVEFDYTRNNANAAATLNAAEETETRQSIGLNSKEEAKNAFGLDDSAFTDEDEGGEEPEQPGEPPTPPSPSGDFDVTITSTNSPVIQGEAQTVQFDATNNLSESQTGTFELSVEGDTVEYNPPSSPYIEDAEFNADETRSFELAWDTSEAPAGDYTATVAAAEGSPDSATVTVQEGSIPSPSGDVSVSIDSTNSPVVETETLKVQATATNNTSSDITADVVLSIDGTVESFASVTAPANGSEDILLPWGTEVGDAGDYTATIDTGTDSASTGVTVQELEAGDFGVQINSTNSPVEELETLTVDATITNSDPTDAQAGTFVLNIDDSRIEKQVRTIGAGESVGLTFKWQTGEGDAGDYTAKIESGTDSASTNVTVEGFPEASGDFAVSIVSTNSPRAEGETVLVTADITNNQSSEQTGTFVLSIDGTPISYREDVTFATDETQTLTFAWATEDGDAGDHTAEVASGTTSDSTTVTVEELDGAPDPSAFNVWIESAPSEITYPDDDPTVTASIVYSGAVSTDVTVRLEEDAPGSIGSTADFNEITMSRGETRTLSLTWSRVDLVPDYFVPGDVQLCVEADRDGVPGVQDEDCATVTIIDNTYVVDETVTAVDEDLDEQPTSVTNTVESGLSNVRCVEMSWSWEPGIIDDEGGIAVELDGEKIIDKLGQSSAISGSGKYDLGKRVSGDLTVLADDGTSEVSPP